VHGIKRNAADPVSESSELTHQNENALKETAVHLDVRSDAANCLPEVERVLPEGMPSLP
jgi:hypothetical protein